MHQARRNDPAGPTGQGGGIRGHGVLPVLRPRGLHHRHRDQHGRRRVPGGVAPAARRESGQLAARTSRTSSATCSGGVCGTMPWPRLNTNGRPRTASQDASRLALRQRRRRPRPAASGSRLPCSATRGRNQRADRLQVRRGIDPQRHRPRSPRAYSASISAGQAGKPDHRHRRIARLAGPRRCARVGPITWARNCDGGSTPAQVSNSITASAPGLDLRRQIDDRRLGQQVDQRREQRRDRHRPGARVAAKSCDPPPSTM